MRPIHWMLGCTLLAPWGAWAAPRVDDVTLSEVPEEVRERLDARERELQVYDDQIAAARSQLARLESAVAQSRDRISAVDGPERESPTRAVGLAELAVDEAIRQREYAEDQVVLAEATLGEARALGEPKQIEDAREAVDEARDEVKDSREEIRERKRELAQAEKVARDVGVDTEAVSDVAEGAQDRATEALASTQLELDRAEARIDLLVAKRELAAAELERERARAATDAGAELALEPYDEAVDDARDRVEDATDRATPDDADEIPESDDPAPVIEP